MPTTTPSRRPDARRRPRAVQAALALGILAALGFAVYRATRPDPIPVVLHEVGKGPVRSTVSNTRGGTVKPCRRARLAPPAGGQIERLMVRQGDRVARGDVLLELWNKDIAAELLLAKEQAALVPLRAREACERAEAAEREALRIEALAADRMVSLDAADASRSQARALRAACQAARAEAASSQARVAAARAALERTVLRAPFDGVVAEVTGELGEFTTPSPPGIPTPPAIDLLDLSCLYVEAPIDEVDAPQVRVGQPAEVTLDAFPQRIYPGRVRAIAPYVLEREKQARTVDVEVELAEPAPGGALQVGYSADVEIVLAVHDGVVRVPTSALLEGNRVLVYQAERERLAAHSVVIGLQNWEWTEVVSGLAAGDQVVVSLEREGLGDGVRARPETPPAATGGT